MLGVAHASAAAWLHNGFASSSSIDARFVRAKFSMFVLSNQDESNTKGITIKLEFQELGLNASDSYTVCDVWKLANLGTFEQGFTTFVTRC